MTNDLHKSFERLKAPGPVGLQKFLKHYSAWAQGGMPRYSRFDFLDWPDLVSWITVVYFPVQAEGRYLPENSVILFDGGARVDMFSGDMTRQSAADLEARFLDRWLPIYTLCMREEAPVFARSEVYGIDKEHIKFEVGLFPFVDEEGSLSHIISPALRIN